MSPETLAAAVGCSLTTATRYARPLTDAMQRWGIDTPVRQAAFLGQVAVESGRLARVEENLTYSAARIQAVWPSRFPTLEQARQYASNPIALAEKVYAGRMGNWSPGDGWRYRGRGLKQLTGRDNYTRYSQASGVDAVGNPDLLLEPRYAADSAGWFWHANGCNGFADRGDWRGLTRRINGGLTGYADRIAAIERALRALGAA